MHVNSVRGRQRGCSGRLHMHWYVTLLISRRFPLHSTGRIPIAVGVPPCEQAAPLVSTAWRWPARALRARSSAAAGPTRPRARASPATRARAPAAASPAPVRDPLSAWRLREESGLTRARALRCAGILRISLPCRLCQLGWRHLVHWYVASRLSLRLARRTLTRAKCAGRALGTCAACTAGYYQTAAGQSSCIGTPAHAPEHCFLTRPLT